MSKVMATRLPDHEAPLVEHLAASRGVTVADLICEALKREVRDTLAAGASARSA